MPTLAIAPGAVHLPHDLPHDQQKVLATQCLVLGSAEAGFYTPRVRGEHPMSVRMLCQF
jgi:hypothetical protein